MVTPYTARNFAIDSPKAREGQLDRFFLQKWHFIYKLSVKKQRTGQITGKNPQKKVVFPPPPISWLSLSEKGPDLFRIYPKQDPVLFGYPKKVRTFSGYPKKVPVLFRINSASWSEGLEKTPFLEGFCPFFVQFFAFSLTICIWNAIFAKKIGPVDLL